MKTSNIAILALLTTLSPAAWTRTITFHNALSFPIIITEHGGGWRSKIGQTPWISPNESATYSTHETPSRLSISANTGVLVHLTPTKDEYTVLKQASGMFVAE